MFKRVYFFVMLLLLLLSNFIYSEEDIQGKIINKIVLKGLKRAKAGDVKNVILSQEGGTLDLGTVDKDYQNLFSLGYFDEIYISTDIAYDKDTKMPLQGMINLIFDFIEKPVIRKTIFDGNKHLAFASLLDDVKIKRGDFLDVTAIHSDMTAVTEKYHKKGYNYIKINYEIFQNEDLKEKNQVDIIYHIEEGIETYINEIIIEGNNNVNEITIKTKLKTKERKYFGLQKGAFVESQFYQDIEDLTLYYKDLGYYFVEILEPEIKRYEIEEEGIKKELISIKIQIKEGDKYTYGGMKINGNKIFSEEELVSNFRLKDGQIFNYSKYQEGIFSLRKRYNDSGYVETIINDEAKVDYEKKIISINVEIIESKQSYIEAVYFKGNEKTKNYILQRTVITEVGEIFNATKLMDSMILLYNLGFFSNVNYEIQPGSAPGLLKIIYIVEEQLTAEIKFGLQIPATADALWGLTIFGELGEKNFLGRDLQFKGRIDGSLTNQGFDISIDDPWFLNAPWSLGASLKFYHTWQRLVIRKIEKEELDGEDYNTENIRDLRDEYSEDSGGLYHKNKNYVIGEDDSSAFNMGIHELTFEAGLRSGYRFLRYFSAVGGISFEPKYTWLPTSNGRTYEILDPVLRWQLMNNYNWRDRLRIWGNFAITTTKRTINPYDGIKFSVGASFNFIHFDSIILNTKFTWYWKILELDFGNWPFRNVLVFNMGLTFIFPGLQYGMNNRPILHNNDALTIDGLFSGRGWANSIAGLNYFNTEKGYVKIDLSLEYRIPIYDQIIWFAGFIDMFNLISGPGQTGFYDNDSWQWWNGNINPNYDPLGIDNWYGSIGVGLELTFPQLPLSFFIVKRFKINYYSGFEWQTNNTGNIDFVLSMVGVAF